MQHLKNDVAKILEGTSEFELKHCKLYLVYYFQDTVPPGPSNNQTKTYNTMNFNRQGVEFNGFKQ